MARPSISLCVIAKDEEDVLPRLFASVRGVVDEIVVVDTGSSDRTREIAEKALPDEKFYGTILRVGLPKGFTPPTMAEEKIKQPPLYLN